VTHLATRIAFSGKPSGTDVGTLNITVTAYDYDYTQARNATGGRPVSTSFELRVDPVPPKAVDFKAPQDTGGKIGAQHAGSDDGSTRNNARTAWNDASVANGISDSPQSSSASGSAPGNAVTGRDSGLTQASGNRSTLPSDIAARPAPSSGSASMTRSEGFQIIVPQQVTQRGPTTANLLLTAPMNDQVVQATQEIIRIQVPADTFTHTRRDAVVSLRATLTDGQALPNWLHFNGSKGEFVGTPPPDFQGDMEVKVVARDNFGNEVTMVFKIHKLKDRVSLTGKPGLMAQMRGEGSRAHAGERSALLAHARQVAAVRRVA